MASNVVPTVDEGGVGPVLEQAAHEISEQFLVAADWRVDAHGRAGVAYRLFEPRHFCVEALAHPMEALEFERRLPRERLHGRNGVRIVRRERGIEDVAAGQQDLGTGEIGDIRRDLARENRIVGQADDLRRLDFRVPVSALHEADH